MGQRDTDDAERDADHERALEVPAAPAAPGPYPGRLDERLLTPTAPLAPGAEMRVFPYGVRPSPRNLPSAMWAEDPSGRHQWRWWGGVDWTEHVADDGVVSEDPLG